MLGLIASGLASDSDKKIAGKIGPEFGRYPYDEMYCKSHNQ